MEQANARITYLELALQKKREDLEKEEENLSKTLAIVQQLAEENIKSEDVWMEEKAFLEIKIDDMEKEVSDIIYRYLSEMHAQYFFRCQR